jgi:hypothetical protein
VDLTDYNLAVALQQKTAEAAMLVLIQDQVAAVDNKFRPVAATAVQE